MPEHTDGYSANTALIYVFNLIIGTGALALPGAISKAGWLPGTVLICVLGLISYITVTFLIETLAIANCVGGQARLQIQEGRDEGRPLLDSVHDDTVGDGSNNQGEDSSYVFDINNKFELIELGTTLLSKPAQIIVLVCLTFYLFGDLSIYCAVIARTLMYTTCTQPLNASCNDSIEDTEPCWEMSSLCRLDMYRIYIVAVVIILTPLVFFDIQKTKWLQFLTSCLRLASFAIMLVWSIQKLSVYGPQGHPHIADIYELPTLFGTCVYSFMCHHSIPSLLQPINNKIKFTKVLPFNYVTVALFYMLLSLTAIWTFSNVEDLYTLNFWSNSCRDSRGSILFLDYFLALFPVFTLSTSFPIIAITLRNNLSKYMPGHIGRILLPMLISLLPASLALIVPNLQLLVGIVGSYAGIALQYVVPMLLVTAARSHCSSWLQNPYKSPFSSAGWIWIVAVWTTISLILISIRYITLFV